MSRNTLSRDNENYYDPWKKSTRKNSRRRPVESFQHMLLRKADKISRHDRDYPYLFDDDIVRFNKASKIQKAYKDHSRRYDHCMDVMTNPNRSTKKTLIECIISYAKELIKNERGEFAHIYNEAIEWFEVVEGVNDGELQDIYAGNMSDQARISFIKVVLQSLEKSEIVDFIENSIGYMFEEVIYSN